MRKGLTTEEFIKRSKKIHKDKYDYSLVKYKRNRDKVKIICPIHGEYWQNAANHLSGMGCKKCAYEARKNKKFLEKCKENHGDKYDYSLVKYKNAQEKIDIICSEHGVFKQKAQNHMKGQGCPYCAGKIVFTEEFIQKAKEIHGNKYDYSLVKYKRNRDKVKIICPKHGMFEQKANSHTSGYGCPVCNESKGERKIRLFLEENKLNFENQKSFENLKNQNGRPFLYDFYLPKHNYLIEFDGEQHFKSIEHWGGERAFKERKQNDYLKNKYAIENKINLLRISYWEFNEIEKILSDILK